MTEPRLTLEPRCWYVETLRRIRHEMPLVRGNVTHESEAIEATLSELYQLRAALASAQQAQRTAEQQRDRAAEHAEIHLGRIELHRLRQERAEADLAALHARLTVTEVQDHVSRAAVASGIVIPHHSFPRFCATLADCLTDAKASRDTLPRQTEAP